MKVQTVKALTLWQPWASAVASGAKKWETRSWSTGYRGPLAIHAAQRRKPEELRSLLSMTVWKDAVDPAVEVDDLPFGCIVAIVDLVDCIPTDSLPPGIGPGERRLGDFSPGRYAWRLENLKTLKRPIEIRGRQRLFTVFVPADRLPVLP